MININNGFKLNIKNNKDLFTKIDRLRKLIQTEESSELVLFWVPKPYNYYANTGKGYWYALFYGPSEIQELLECQKWISEFNYWNEGEKPQKLSKLQWKRRRKIWDEVLLDKKPPIPAKHGIYVKLS